VTCEAKRRGQLLYWRAKDDNRLLTLEQEVVLDSVTTVDSELARSLFRSENFECRSETSDTNRSFPSSVGTWDGEIEVFRSEKFG